MIFQMENKTELDRIIEGINRNKNVSDITSDNMEKWNLTEGEKDIIKKDQPEKSLIIYGTLAPNRLNHSVVKHIKGKWQRAIVRGKLENKGWGAELGYFGFKPVTKEEQNDIEAFILFSDELV